MKKFLLILSLIVLAGTATADVENIQYVVDVGSETEINATITQECGLYCSGISWRLPEDAEVLSVKNSAGDVEYERRSDTLNIDGWKATDGKVLRISMAVDRDNTVYQDLKSLRLSLPGFNGVDTTGIVEVDNLVSLWVQNGFEYSTQEDLRFQGEGPVNFQVNYGKGIERGNFVFYGETVENSSSAFNIALGTVRRAPGTGKYPVAVMPPEEYSDLETWSAGRYKSGVIYLKNDINDKSEVLAHETAHGLLSRELKWDETKTDYVDEGVARYIEFLTRKSLGKRTRNVFGEDVSYQDYRKGQLYMVTLPSKGDREDLWKYYQEDRGSMKRWTPREGSESSRSFGYAYSELIVKNYVVRHGNISQVFDDLNRDTAVDDPAVKWQIFSQYMDMTPCKYESRERFESCLDRINSYDYPVYASTSFSQTSENLDVDRVEVPEKPEISNPEKAATGFIDFLKALIDSLIALV